MYNRFEMTKELSGGIPQPANEPAHGRRLDPTPVEPLIEAAGIIAGTTFGAEQAGQIVTTVVTGEVVDEWTINPQGGLANGKGPGNGNPTGIDGSKQPDLIPAHQHAVTAPVIHLDHFFESLAGFGLAAVSAVMFFRNRQVGNFFKTLFKRPDSGNPPKIPTQPRPQGPTGRAA